jgi:hypothetical protein
MACGSSAEVENSTPHPEVWGSSPINVTATGKENGKKIPNFLILQSFDGIFLPFSLLVPVALVGFEPLTLG